VAVFIGKEVGRNRAKIEEYIFHMTIKVISRVFGSDRVLKASVGGSRNLVVSFALNKARKSSFASPHSGSRGCIY
jgi:hypothetical protein